MAGAELTASIEAELRPRLDDGSAESGAGEAAASKSGGLGAAAGVSGAESSSWADGAPASTCTADWLLCGGDMDAFEGVTDVAVASALAASTVSLYSVQPGSESGQLRKGSPRHAEIDVNPLMPTTSTQWRMLRSLGTSSPWHKPSAVPTSNEPRGGGPIAG